MFNAVIITSNALRRELLQQVALESNQILAARLWDRFPSPYELTQMMKTVVPDIAFLDYTEYAQADNCAVQIEADYPKTVIIGFGGNRVPDDPGVTAYLPFVPEVAEFSKIVEQAVCKVRGAVLDNLITFLPAKAGSGCSSVVLNTAAMLAGPLQRKTLVIEGDLRSGSLSVFLNCTPEWFVQNALKSAGEMDSTKLNQCVLQKHAVDWMFANAASRDPLPAWHHYFRLLEFVKDKYASILVDLPELVNRPQSKLSGDRASSWSSARLRCLRSNSPAGAVTNLRPTAFRKNAFASCSIAGASSKSDVVMLKLFSDIRCKPYYPAITRRCEPPPPMESASPKAQLSAEPSWISLVGW